ncbi:hypothetical protein AB0M80_33935 [Amycolatopsis sp. NPDC051045]|uniref:hypothetical protein n=1 Tax=Amycolatopsis sp. NPDC051045 TaxID=3156922 RepID=UPI00343DD9B0
MSVHAAVARPVLHTLRGRHAKPRPAWPRVAARAVSLIFALVCAGAVVGFGWPPALLVAPAAAFVLLGAGVAQLRTAARKIDTIFAEELSEPARQDTIPDATRTDRRPVSDCLCAVRR